MAALASGACGEPPRATTSLSPGDIAPPALAAPVVVARYDAARHDVPLPNDLYRGSQVLSVPAEAAQSDAEADLFARLRGVSGYFAQSAISFPLSGPLDEATVAGATLLFNPDTQAVVAHSIIVRPDAVVLVPDAPLSRSSRFVAALRQGPTGPAGEPFVRDEAYQAYAEGRGAAYELRAEAGVTAALAAVQSRGIDPDEIVVSTLFTVTDDDAFPFGTGPEDTPFPSLAHMSALGLSIPGPTFAAQFADALVGYDGFGTQSPVQFPFPEPAANNAALHNAMALYTVDDDGLRPVEATHTGTFAGGGTIAPTAALAPEQDVVAALHTGPTAGGRLFTPGLTLLAVTSPAPLTDDDGRSTVRLIADARAAELETLRPAYAEAALFLDADGTPRDELLALSRYPLLHPKTRVLAMRQALYDQQVDPTPHNLLVATPEERGIPFVLSDVDTVVTGDITTLDFLAGDSVALSVYAEETPVDFILTIPDGTTPGTPIPVVLFGHGLFTTRELVYLAADFLAAAGFAALCIDFPLHGKRTPCLQSSDCTQDAMCEADGMCRTPDGSEVPVASVQSPWPGGPAVPVATGRAFINLQTPAKTRDHFLQGLVDLSQAVRSIQLADWAGSTGYTLDGNDIVYLGMSLGGIYGASFSAIEDQIGSFALNVPGAGLVDLMQESQALLPDVQDFAFQTGTLPGTEAHFAYVSTARWIFDLADPQNLVRPHPGKRYLIQMANGDEMVSNDATHRLADALGEPIQEYFPLLGHAFLFDPTSLESEAARDEIIAFFAAR